MKNVLVLCTGNSCRSQMAEGYLRRYGGHNAVIYSAGIETHGVNPLAISTMRDDGVDISSHTSNNVQEYKDVNFDYVITVCDHASERCPVFPSTAKKIHHNFPDPAKATGTEADIKKAFENTRNLIREYCKNFVEENFSQT